MMSKPISALFGVLTLVAILAIAPSAFAQESQTTVNISAGAGSGPNCSQSNNCFSPDTVTVAPGTTVEWQNNDKVSHTVTSGSPSDNQTGTIFDSSLIAAGKDFTYTFNNPGTYNYFCQVHPWMTGQVIVSASAATTPSTTSNNMPSGMTMPSSNTPSNTTNTNPAGQGQQGGIPLGSPYSAPANMSAPSAPTQPAPPSQAPQYGSQVPSTTMAGQGQQNGIPLGASYQSNQGTTPTNPGSSVGYTDADNPSGPLQMAGWGAGMAVAAILTGVGVWSSVRRR
ncbi:MAG TPA: plastocyanin/azurin family copper-binding protein [Candidatus Nitrosotalea sp.]|nr:plastocyanin/azurin family copper-binding protein [Candidatus Nitrosotalea sp.]